MSGLSKFRVDELDKTPRKPSRIQVNFEGLVLAFDQTLSSTGWCLMRSKGYIVEAVRTGMCTTNAENKGSDQDLVRGELIFNQFQTVIENNEPMWIVHEAPPVGGGKLSRPESSLLAALALRIAAAQYVTPLTMIHARKAKNRLTGNPGATKKEVREGVLWQLPTITDFKPLNEHVYDAAAIGLVAIEEGYQ